MSAATAHNHPLSDIRPKSKSLDPTPPCGAASDPTDQLVPGSTPDAPAAEAAAEPGGGKQAVPQSDDRAQQPDGAEPGATHELRLAQTLHSFQRCALFCDTVLLTAGGGAVHAHSAVLAALCPRLLPALNQNPLGVHQPNVVDLTRYSLALVTRVTDFFYTGQLCPAARGEGKEAGRELREVFELLGVTFDPAALPGGDGGGEGGGQSIAEWVDANIDGLDDGDEKYDANAESSLELQLPSDLPTELQRELFVDGRGSRGDRRLPPNNTGPSRVTGGRRGRRKGVKRGPYKKTRLGLGSPPPLNFECKFCPLKFKSKYAVDRHKWSHYWCADTSVYRCKICAREFKFCATFRTHMRTTHAQVRNSAHLYAQLRTLQIKY